MLELTRLKHKSTNNQSHTHMEGILVGQLDIQNVILVQGETVAMLLYFTKMN